MAGYSSQARHIAFTPGRIQAMKWDGRTSDIRYDSSPKAPGSGFGIRVYPTGRKSYVLQYRAKERVKGSGVLLKTVRNKVHLKVLGNAATMSLSTAREIGLKLIQEIEVGIDPSEDRSLEGITLREFLPIYLEVKKREGIADKSLYDIARRIENYLTKGFYRINKKKKKLKVRSESGRASLVYQKDFVDEHTLKFRDKPLSKIKRSDFHDLYQGISSGELSVSGKPSSVESNRLHVHLSNMYKVAEIKGAIPEGTSYPTRLIKKTRETPRKRYLSDPELEDLYEALREEPQGPALYAIQLFCHQGVRKNELLKLRWSDVHLDRVPGRECEQPHIYVGKTKTGTNLFSVLAPQAIRIFEHLAAQKSSERVFPTKDIRYAWERIRQRAGLGAYTLHDLRHCVGTWLARLGQTELVISRTLNHEVKRQTEKYSLVPNETQEQALTELADWLQEQVGEPILKELTNSA